MRRSNEEFRAEVFRRKEVYIKARNKRAVRRVLRALVCLPLCGIVTFMGLMLAIAMHPASGADPNANSDGKGASYKETLISADDPRLAPLCAFFAEITAREPESTVFDWDLNRSFSEKVIIEPEGKSYYLTNMYVFDGKNTFSITLEEYKKFLDIIILEGSEDYEK